MFPLFSFLSTPYALFRLSSRCYFQLYFAHNFTRDEKNQKTANSTKKRRQRIAISIRLSKAAEAAPEAGAAADAEAVAVAEAV